MNAPRRRQDRTPGFRQSLLDGALALYRQILSPLLHETQRAVTGTTGSCRFQPTCSEYAALALHEHGAWRGGRLALFRLLRCHPFARGGFDPVPPVSKHGQISEQAALPGPQEQRRATVHLS